MYFLSPCCLFFTEFRYVRLVGGTSHCTGKLEMKYQGEWRPVKPLPYSKNMSAVVCRQLDCGSLVSLDVYESASQRVWSIPSSCNGSESLLIECGTVEHEESSQRVNVICSGNTNTSTMILKLHLLVSSCTAFYLYYGLPMHFSSKLTHILLSWNQTYKILYTMNNSSPVDKNR